MLVSVYIPTRDREATLRAAVRSVLEQSYAELELIVVDEASNDGTSDYLQRLAAREQRVRHIRHEVAQGAPAARNAAIRAANGDFVTGLDDDDRFHRERLGALVEYWKLLAARGETPSFLYTQDVCAFGPREEQVSQKKGSVRYEDMFAMNQVGNQIFAPKRHFVEAGLFDEALPAWQDLEFFMRVLLRFGEARLLDLPLYWFDVSPRPDRITSQTRERLYQAYELVAEKHAGGFPQRRQRLFLQLFTAGYGTLPTVRDFAHFLRFGPWPAGFGRLAKRRFFPLLVSS